MLPGYMLIDTETSGLMDYKRSADAPGQPRVAEFAAIVTDLRGNPQSEYQRYIRPPLDANGMPGWTMSDEVTAINKIHTDMLIDKGVPVSHVLEWYSTQIERGYAVVAYGAQFDCKMMRAEMRRAGIDDLFEKTPNVCIMRTCRTFAKQIGREIVKAGASQKGWPKLSDLCNFLEVEHQGEAHGALADVRTLHLCFRRMLELGYEPAPEVHFSKNLEEIRSAS